MSEGNKNHPGKSRSGKLCGPMVSLGTIINGLLSVFFIVVASYSENMALPQIRWVKVM
jgi:hypothetical protein